MMKRACALLAAVGVAQVAAEPAVGTYGDGNQFNSEWDAVVVGGDMNTASGKFSSVGGGYKNVARGDYSTISGGTQNTVKSNYGTILGGFDNVVSGRFGTVLGGSKNTAAGRHSAALGFGAKSTGDYAFTACFTGEPCTNDADNSIAFFANNMYINDVDLNDVLPSVRRVLAEEDGGIASMESAEKLVAKYSADFYHMLREVDDALLIHEDILNSIAESLDDF